MLDFGSRELQGEIDHDLFPGSISWGFVLHCKIQILEEFKEILRGGAGVELPKVDETEVTSQEVLLNNLGIKRVGREGEHYAQSSLISVSCFEMQTSTHLDQIFFVH